MTNLLRFLNGFLVGTLITVGCIVAELSIMLTLLIVVVLGLPLTEGVNRLMGIRK